MLDFLSEVRFRDLIDVFLMAFLLYTIIVWGRLARVGRILSGLGSLGLIYIVARLLELQLTVWVFQGLFAVLAIVLIVIFQSELRQLFDRLAAWSFREPRNPYPDEETTEPLISAVSRLSASKIGALIVIAGQDSIERHIAGGIRVDALVSAPLIESIFDRHSPGHDGAVLLDGNRVSHFGLHLPLSTDFAQLKSHGTRHAAALGLTERSDALCIVVSEESGTISVARDGSLQELGGTPELASRMEAFLKERSSSSSGADPQRRVLSLRRHWLEKMAALVIAVAAWIAFASDFGTQGLVWSVPVIVDNVSAELRVTQIEPALVSMVVGRFSEDATDPDPGVIRIRLDASRLGPGRHVLRISGDDVVPDSDLEVIDVDPEFVEFLLVEASPQDSNAAN